MSIIIGLIAATCTTISFLPQTIKTIKTKNTSSLSFSMYLIFNVGLIMWLIYGILLNDWPIIISNGISLTMTLTILWIIYQNKNITK